MLSHPDRGRFRVTYLTSQEVADLLRVSDKTIQRWRADGSGPPYYRLGGAIRYIRDEVLEWIQTGRVRTTTDNG